MKLHEWLIEEWKSKDEAEGLHVIGTCGTCKYKKNFPEVENVCKHPDNWVENGFPDSFGCIHWTTKEPL